MKLLFRSIFSLVLFATMAVAQNGTRLIDYNSKSLGRGGTSIGVFDSPNLILTNPGGISFMNGSVINANLSLMLPSLHFNNNINDLDGENNIYPLPSLSYVNKYEDSDFSWGLGFFTVGGMGADFKMKHALYRNQDGSYNLQEYHSMLALMQGGLTAAYKITNKFSVGVTTHLVYSQLEFSMPYSLLPETMKGIANPQTGMTFGQMFAAPPAQGGFGYTEVTALAKMDGLSAIGFNGKIGFAYEVNDNLSFGLSYTMPTSLTYENGKANMDMTAQLNDAFGKAVQGAMAQGMTQAQAEAAVMAQFTGMGIDLSKGVVADYDLNVDLAFPQTIGFGFSYKADKFMVAADIEWLNWEKAFDKMTIKLSNGANPNINKMLGNTGAFNLEFPMYWENTIAVKLGGEYKATDDLTLRAGFAYGSNPVPSTTVFPVFPAIVENHVMAGLSYRVTTAITLHTSYEMALNKSMTADRQSYIANEYDGSTSQLANMLFHLGLSYSF